MGSIVFFGGGGGEMKVDAEKTMFGRFWRDFCA